MDNNASKELVDRITTLPEYEDTFISSQDAMLRADGKSLLVVVDTNRPDQVESKELLMSCNKVVVIDHHRRASDYISDAALNIHEPYASSASELVSEMLQYLVEQSDILKLEAEALMSGIVLDTKNFTMRTGSRTFEAAAFLRRSGSDTAEVKRMMQNDVSSTIARYNIVKEARVYRDDIAIAAVDTQEDRIVAAQAADELLNIAGISASFVVFHEKNSINISARSIGHINVQLVLEKLGGGGNQATAGAQLQNKTYKEVLAALLNAIDSYIEEEE